MRTFVRAVAAVPLVLMLSTISAPVASAEPDTRFGSCREMRQVDPLGVARTETAVARAVRAGFRPPLLCPIAYRANRHLDRDRDGVACERR